MVWGLCERSFIERSSDLRGGSVTAGYVGMDLETRTCFFPVWDEHIVRHPFIGGENVGHNMSQTDAMSTGGESGRGGHAGNTGTGCFKNHEHSMHLGASAASAVGRSTTARRQSCGASAATGAVSIAAVTALLTSSPATTGIIAHQNNQPTQQQQAASSAQAPFNSLVDLGDPCRYNGPLLLFEITVGK